MLHDLDFQQPSDPQPHFFDAKWNRSRVQVSFGDIAMILQALHEYYDRCDDLPRGLDTPRVDYWCSIPRVIASRWNALDDKQKGKLIPAERLVTRDCQNRR